MKRALLVLAVTSLLALTAPAMAERSELGELQLTEVAAGLEHPWPWPSCRRSRAT